jgi:hypothetical protein
MGVVGAALRGFGRALKRKGKVAPTIKSVKPTKDIAGSVKRVKQDEFRKRYTALDKAESKIREGRKMMREGQKERKRMVDTFKRRQVMPLTPKGKKIMKSMKKQYGAKKGETVFYASKNKGAIKGVDKKRKK